MTDIYFYTYEYHKKCTKRNNERKGRKKQVKAGYLRHMLEENGKELVTTLYAYVKNTGMRQSGVRTNQQFVSPRVFCIIQ